MPALADIIKLFQVHDKFIDAVLHQAFHFFMEFIRSHRVQWPIDTNHYHLRMLINFFDMNIYFVHNLTRFRKETLKEQVEKFTKKYAMLTKTPGHGAWPEEFETPRTSHCVRQLLKQPGVFLFRTHSINDANSALSGSVFQFLPETGRLMGDYSENHVVVQNAVIQPCIRTALDNRGKIFFPVEKYVIYVHVSNSPGWLSHSQCSRCQIPGVYWQCQFSM